MTCEVCRRVECVDPQCVALRVLLELQTQDEARIRSEREQLTWDVKRHWHRVRGLEFRDPPPKSYAEKECEKAFARFGL